MMVGGFMDGWGCLLSGQDGGHMPPFGKACVCDPWTHRTPFSVNFCKQWHSAFCVQGGETSLLRQIYALLRIIVFARRFFLFLSTCRYTIQGPKVVGFMLFHRMSADPVQTVSSLRENVSMSLRSLPQVLMNCGHSQVVYQTLSPVCVEVIANPKIANACRISTGFQSLLCKQPFVSAMRAQIATNMSWLEESNDTLS